MRIAKRITLRSVRLRGMLDFDNLFNSNNVLRMNGAYGTDGAAWARPQAIVPAGCSSSGRKCRSEVSGFLDSVSSTRRRQRTES
ncbi:MAG TPA: hypothetical protein VFB92_18260 [Vicinamibacterales bacterium]|nr:hypothetical protein [Vicinamibacterales bacterium]